MCSVFTAAASALKIKIQADSDDEGSVRAALSYIFSGFLSNYRLVDRDLAVIRMEA